MIKIFKEFINMNVQTGVILVFLLGLMLEGPISTEGRKAAPLLEDDWVKRPNRDAECTFGKQRKELGSKWNADLGPPFGVMYCIKCECIPIQKKRRIVAKVQCRNIKNECPIVECDDAELLPGKCCKSCPGQYSTELVQDVPIQLTIEEEERSLKHFGTIVSSKTSRQVVDRVNEAINFEIYSYVATGRFTFNRKNLYYSFYLGVGTPRPNIIQFIDDTGSILEEQKIEKTIGYYQNSTDKLCGVWKRVPRDYRKLLRDEEMYISLIWEIQSSTTSELKKSALTGQLLRYKALSTEQFSSLLEPTLGSDRSVIIGSTATSIISVSSVSAPSIHVSIVVNGLFLPDDISDVPLTVLIEHQEKNYIILQDEIIIKKPSDDINFGEVRSAITANDLRLLSRGKLTITIASKKDPQALRLSGTIGNKVTCDIYQGLISSESTSHASGIAWAFLDRYGALRYGVNLNGLEDENPIVTIVDDGGKKKTELEDLTPTLIGGSNANGTLDRPSPRLLESLFKGELSIVAASPIGSLLRGRLIQKSIADAKDNLTPTLIKSPVSGTMFGIVWLNIDPIECTLYYELEITGLPEEYNKQIDDEEYENQTRLKLYLETMPVLAEGAPVSKRLLEEFNGNTLEGSINGLSQIEIYRIDSGIGFLELIGFNNNITSKLMKTQFKTRAPINCLPHFTDNDVGSNMIYNLHPPNSEIETSSCFHETKFYDDGTQWTAKSNSCLMCHCRLGITNCDPVPCPPLNCPIDRIINPPVGHCCSICMRSQSVNSTTPTPSSSSSSLTTATTTTTTTAAAAVTSILNPPTPASHEKIIEESNNVLPLRGCTLAGQFHPSGSSWHPYLPPSGFDTCAICTCDPVNLEVRCPRVPCPPLSCNEKLASRPDKKACCKVCPIISQSTNNLTHDINLPHDQPATKLSAKRIADDIIAAGGCKYPVGGPYENGREWHPKIHSHGEIKCVKCRCKDGEVKCDRKRCPRSLCNTIVNQLKRGERIPDADECCTTQCKRARRHNRNHYNNNYSQHHQQLRHSSSKNQKHSLTPKNLS